MRQPVLSEAVETVGTWCDCHRPVALILCKHGTLWWVYPDDKIAKARSRGGHADHVLLAPINACSEGPKCQ